MKFIKHISLIGILLLLAMVGLFAQETTLLNCLEVQSDGSVVLSWTPPEDLNGFEKYVINYSSNGTTYLPVDEINDPAVDTYLHAGTNAKLGSRHYYISTVYTSAEINTETDILRTIFLQVDDTDPAFAKLYWNAVGDPLPSGSSTFYEIHKEHPANNWTVIDSLTGTTYDDPIIVCNDTITYQIVIRNENNCSSKSNARGGWFNDEIWPIIPVFDSVSINSDNHSVLGWTASVSGDVTGYIIYRFEVDRWVEINRILESSATSYTDLDSDPCNTVFQYAIAAIDSCGNKSVATYEFPRNTILLDDIENNVCGATNMLQWTPYINGVPNLEGYKIFCKEDNGEFTEVGKVDSESTSYIHDSINIGVNYTYYIQAFFGEGSSSSCQKTILTASYLKPDFVYLANADVLITNQVALTIDVDTAVYSCTWEIWRSDTNGGNLYQIAAIDKTELSGFPLIYTDTTAEAWSGFYDYQVKVIDSCGRETIESNILRTILLGGSIVDEDHILLSWSAFEGWDAGVDKYLIFRKSGGIEPTLPIDSVDASVLSYTDDISSVGGTSEPVSYWIQAIENAGNTHGYKEKSNSNRIGTALESEMYVANAFQPIESGTDFKPVFRFFSGTDYLFQIFNRWGQLIFESNNPDIGWNGKYKGNYVSLGTYVYTLGYKNLDATSVSKKGTVTVIY